jgi:hypothetical protein
VVVGDARFDSRLFSNRWTLARDSEPLAEMQRDPSRLVSRGSFSDGTTFDLIPNGWGTVEMEVDDIVLARIDRRSWWGRRWEISGTGFVCDLTSDRAPRRWTLRIGGQPVGRLKGSLLSYNRLDVHTDIATPVHALVLAWQVLARPWEQAAAPRTLVPDRIASG